MSDFPTGLVAQTQLLPADNLGESGAAALQKLAAQGYEVHIGLTAALAAEILTMAQEPAIREYCPKDSTERFADQAAAKRWLAKGRAVFVLLQRIDDDELKLVGYGWAGPAGSPHVPDGKITFALRIGEAGHGRGLATPFCWLVIAGSAALYGAEDFWLETWASNAAAVHIYHKLGFETVGEEPAERPTADDGTVTDIRTYMRLPNRLLPDQSPAAT